MIDLVKAKNDSFSIEELNMEVKKSNNKNLSIPTPNHKKIQTGQLIQLIYVLETLYNCRLIYAFVALKTIVRQEMVAAMLINMLLSAYQFWMIEDLLTDITFLRRKLVQILLANILLICFYVLQDEFKIKKVSDYIGNRVEAFQISNLFFKIVCIDMLQIYLLWRFQVHH